MFPFLVPHGELLRSDSIRFLILGQVPPAPLPILFPVNLEGSRGWPTYLGDPGNTSGSCLLAWLCLGPAPDVTDTGE